MPVEVTKAKINQQIWASFLRKIAMRCLSGLVDLPQNDLRRFIELNVMLFCLFIQYTGTKILGPKISAPQTKNVGAR